jgi:c-di-GMP-binding flagellar brake protein YcgR
MLNLSETGCGAVFEKDEAPPFERGHLYYTTFSLPDDPEPFAITTEIRRTQDHPAGDRVMAGMAWQLDPRSRPDRAIQTRIARFITHEQREALRRARAE